MSLIIILAVVVAFVLCPSVFLCIMTNIFKTIKYSVLDLANHIRYKKKRLAKTGEIIAYVGLFGKGKTLSAVNRVCTIYRAKNGLRVYCPRRKKWVSQRVNIVSNVHLKYIPYTKFVSLEQVVMSTDNVRKFDDDNDTLTCTYILIDEAGSELNCREHKTNIDPETLNAILTSRHWNISIILTAQRFQHIDALLRQVTTYVYSCEKAWRFQFLKKFDAWELEQASSPANIACQSIICWFIRDIDFNAYDTYECVTKLKKQMINGKMLTAEEVIKLKTGFDTVNMDGVHHSKKYRKRHKSLW